MLSADEKRELDAEAAHYRDRRALGIEALKIVQRHRGWISDAALGDAAAAIGLPPAELEGVASFYNLLFRRPVGRHVVLACDGVSCWIAGCERLLQAAAERHGLRPGETDADGRFTLLPVACLGACDRAPVALVDEDLHGNLDPERLAEVLARYG